MRWPPRFLFTSGRLAIDFVHTGGEGDRTRWERWHSAGDLAEWIAACPRLKVEASVSARDLGEARELREAIWAGAHAIARGDSPASTEVLRRIAARPDLVPELRAGEMRWARGPTGGQVLSTVARDAIELFGSDLKARLRRCANPDCWLLFVDTSRPGKRAWCSMRRCGNLTKIARYRAAERRRARREAD